MMAAEEHKRASSDGRSFIFVQVVVNDERTAPFSWTTQDHPGPRRCPSGGSWAVDAVSRGNLYCLPCSVRLCLFFFRNSLSSAFVQAQGCRGANAEVGVAAAAEAAVKSKSQAPSRMIFCNSLSRGMMVGNKRATLARQERWLSGVVGCWTIMDGTCAQPGKCFHPTHLRRREDSHLGLYARISPQSRPRVLAHRLIVFQR